LRLAPYQYGTAERAIGFEGDPHGTGRVVIGLESLHRERLALEIREQWGGRSTGKTNLCATYNVTVERLGRPDLYLCVVALPGQVDSTLHRYVTNVQRTDGLRREASRSELPQEMGLTIAKPLLEKGRSEGREAAAALAGERLWERVASIHRRFNSRRRKMVAETNRDVVDTRNGQEGVANVFGHHIGKIRGTPTRWQLDGNGRMAVVDGEGADKTQLENRLVQFGVQHVAEPFQEG